MFLFTTLVPIFSLIAVGYLVVRRGFISKDSVKDFNNLVYYIGLPALLFYKIGQSNIDIIIVFKPTVIYLIGMLVGGIVAAVYLLAVKRNMEDFWSEIQVIVRSNTTFIGLPLIFYFFDSIGYSDIPYVQNITILLLAVLVPINNVIGVAGFIIFNKSDKGVLVAVIKNIMKNPIILACIAGIIYSLLFDGFAMPIKRTFEAMSGMTLPLSLIAVGCVLAEIKLAGSYNSLIMMSFMKLLVLPMIVLAAGKLLGYSAEIISIPLIMMACPSASTCVTIAQQFNGNVRLTSTVIFVTSVMSIFTLAIILAICKQLF